MTVARLSQSGGALLMVIGAGEILQRPRPFQGTCAVLRWDQPVSAVMATVFGFGLEHHVGIVHGDHSADLESLAAAPGPSRNAPRRGPRAIQTDPP